MFGGSVNVPDFDGRLSAAGGHSNAWTSSDFTNFYDVLPAVNLSTALWLESDRMLQLDFSERSLQVQQSVVVMCDGCLEIPQFGTKHSMNVSVTAGMVIWTIVARSLSDAPLAR